MAKLTTSDIVAFLAKNRVPAETVQADTALFSSGLLDSASMLELMVFLEQRAGITVSPADVTLDNLDSPEKIIAFVDRVAA